MPRYVGDADRSALRQAQQRKALKPRRVDHSLQVEHPVFEIHALDKRMELFERVAYDAFERGYQERGLPAPDDLAGQVEPLFAITAGIDRVAFGLKPLCYLLAQHLFVFDQQDAHDVNGRWR